VPVAPGSVGESGDGCEAARKERAYDRLLILGRTATHTHTPLLARLLVPIKKSM
jgi:hypothetical protein